MPNDPSTARILVIDDEPNIRMPLVRALELGGYATQHVDSGAAALELLQRAHFDLIVLDMQMPGIHGIDVMRQARQLYPDLGIIILTGHATLESAIAAVKSDAVDYLTKPTSLQDIVTTVINALGKHQSRRQRQQLLQTALIALHQAEALETADESCASEQLPPSRVADFVRRVGNVTFDCNRRRVTTHDTPPRSAELTKGEALVLEALLRQPNQTLSCRELARVTWNYDLEEIEAQSLVRPYIFRLRQKIERNPDDPQLILTVRGSGYLFSAR